MKDKGTIRNTETVEANGIQFLNGEICKRFYKVPVILLDYQTPVTAHWYAKGERFKFWIKLEASQFKKIEEQLRKDLREISIWFDKDSIEKLKQFINKIEVKENESK